MGNGRDRHVRAAASGFSSLVADGAAHVFVLADADIVAVYREANQEAVAAEVEKVRYLFGDDPTVAEDTARRRFVTWFDVERDYEAFLRAVRARFDGRPVPDRRPSTPAPAASLAARERNDVVINPATLSQIERTLATADLSSMMRRQTACSVAPDFVLAPRFTELFVSIEELRQTVMPEADLAANPWLFRQLTRTLDRRVLSYLAAPDVRFDGAWLSVNVNVSSLLNDIFLAFERQLGGAGPTSVAFEVQSVDVFSDIASFLFARDFANRKGFRMFLDGVRWHDLDVVRPAALAVDMVKVLWDADLLQRGSRARECLQSLVSEVGADRVVLCRVDNRDAVTTGQALGLRLFQGHVIDAMLREENRRRGLRRLKGMPRRDT